MLIKVWIFNWQKALSENCCCHKKMYNIYPGYIIYIKLNWSVILANTSSSEEIEFRTSWKRDQLAGCVRLMRRWMKNSKVCRWRQPVSRVSFTMNNWISKLAHWHYRGGEETKASIHILVFLNFWKQTKMLESNRFPDGSTLEHEFLVRFYTQPCSSAHLFQRQYCPKNT